ncbi:retrovirus-related pol polyprotein from transposon TNT 1-94 [Tanacetum coccineum]|uniref:Retrovirus-related pol polyprotein from transposon TNT 1-94 n=1 Tax=Tanacetum coccineum TaxID=301880 RepID=A0ABQ5CAT7_9ASTR
MGTKTLNSCLLVGLPHDLQMDDWIVDNGCTKHMTGNRRSFITYKEYDDGHIVFGSNLKGKVIGGGNISHESTTITNVEHFDPKSYEGVFLGYSQTSKAYIVINKETIRIEESLNVTFDVSLPEPKSSPLIEDDRINEPIVQYPVRSLSLEVNVLELGYPKSVKEARGHLIEQVIGELNKRTLRSKTKQA